MPRRLDDLGALAAADPARHHHLSRVDVLEAVALHFGDRPFDRAIERGRAAEPVADRVGQHRQPAATRTCSPAASPPIRRGGRFAVWSRIQPGASFGARSGTRTSIAIDKAMQGKAKRVAACMSSSNLARVRQRGVSGARAAERRARSARGGDCTSGSGVKSSPGLMNRSRSKRYCLS